LPLEGFSHRQMTSLGPPRDIRLLTKGSHPNLHRCLLWLKKRFCIFRGYA